jgi:hypothetical protein
MVLTECLAVPLRLLLVVVTVVVENPHMPFK